MNYKLISNEIDVVLSKVHDLYLSQGRPTKRGRLRFLDWVSNKTFAFEKTQEKRDGNLLILSAPYSGDSREKIESKLKRGPYGKQLEDASVRSGKDKVKKTRQFIEVSYFIPSSVLLEDKKVLARMGKTGKLASAGEAVRKILREYVEPMAKECMDYFVEIIREFCSPV